MITLTFTVRERCRAGGVVAVVVYIVVDVVFVVVIVMIVGSCNAGRH